ncbi:hypothetical protein SKAU_G00304180 [Synaphobranchus kaupii]|uniref:Uncharacterized protein n=1 Tax=Synaphobranchus kaupii TaxID=118154 RepID=A0A9Q1ILF8_SYNKA|nr:hypothetical protein SKAU_G00304180 [Synaphobranchus kaupii]
MFRQRPAYHATLGEGGPLPFLPKKGYKYPHRLECDGSRHKGSFWPGSKHPSLSPAGNHPRLHRQWARVPPMDPAPDPAHRGMLSPWRLEDDLPAPRTR